MNKCFLITMAIIATFICLIGCSNTSNGDSSGDWASNFVVWEGYKYDVSKKEVIDEEGIESSLGAVEQFSDDENVQLDFTKVFSNKFPVGTKIYSIRGLTTDNAIAVESDGKFFKGKNSGKYGN